MDEYDRKQFDERFKLVCKKCGNENCIVNFDAGHVYSELSDDPPRLYFGCNQCGQNDLTLYP